VSAPVGEDDLMAWIDGRLPPERQAAVDRYLAGHPQEAARLRMQADQRQQLVDTFAPIAAEPIPAGMRISAIAARRRAGTGWWQAMAAAILLAVGFGGGWGMRDMTAPPRAGIAALAQEATDSYRVYASDTLRPAELSDREQLVHWMSARLGGAVAVPDLAATGYRFLGGRLVATAHGPAALFLYDGPRSHRIAVLTRPMEIDKTARMTATAEEDVDRVSWADDGRGYSVVSSRRASRLQAIADTIRSQVNQT
jgi:anti-sigma factor RsiW